MRVDRHTTTTARAERASTSSTAQTPRWLSTPPEPVVAAPALDSTPSNLVTACGVCQYNKGSCTIDELCLADPRDRPPAIDEWRGLTEAVASISAIAAAPDGDESPIDFELEYLIAYGRTTGQLPAVKDLGMVEMLVRVYEAALPQTGA